MTTKVLPEKWDMNVYHGDVWPAWNFDVVDDANSPLAGFTVLMQVRKTISGEVLKEFTNGVGFTLLANNVEFDAEVDLPEGEFIYDIQITLSNGEVHTQYAGKITVTQDVSR